MYYRRKILLSLLEVFDDELEKICLQKLLFLVSMRQKKSAFDFVPYKYGCFSFRANADLHTMIKYEQVSKNEKKWKRETSVSFIDELKPDDKKIITLLKKEFTNVSPQELLRATYTHYPYYAINSTILDTVCTPNEKEKVLEKRNTAEDTCLFTIGYEGISLEAYLNKLLQNNVKVLIDVRKNAMSMKYGFNKSQLKNACEGVHIKYLHFPQVGIASNKRKSLNTQKDYDSLFNDYKESVLKTTETTQNKLLSILKKYKRVALTCFEANQCQCHRTPLAHSILHQNEEEYDLKHL